MQRINRKKFFSIPSLFLALFLVFSANISIVSANYQDNESANGNEFSASYLDAETSSTQTGLEPEATASSMVPGTSVSRDGNIENTGNENFQYRVEFEKVSGSDILCDALQIQAEKNGMAVYNNDLLDFTVDGGTLNSGNNDDWDFTITIPLGTSHNVEGLDCNFNLKFISWQTNFVGPTEGWVDEEEISGNEITAGDWEPVISGVENSDVLDTKGGTNSEMSKVSVSWSTDENTTSNIVYDIVSQVGCAGYALASTPDAVADSTDHEVTLSNLVAGTTYYYRAVSEDNGGNEVCSNEYSFTIPSSSADAPSSSILLNEFVPNPFGLDSANKPNGEWVELYNTSGADIGVNGWYIYDSSNSNGVQVTSVNTDSGDTVVPAHGWLVVYLNKAYLNNDGDTVQLYSNAIASGGVLMDSHVYAGTIPEGKSFARFPDGVGVWIDPDVTPGKVNQLKEKELKQFREMAVTECFNSYGIIKKSKKDICQKEFLVYIGILESKKSKKISSEMLELINKSKEDDEIEEDKEKEIKKDKDNDLSGENNKNEKVESDENEKKEELNNPVKNEEDKREESPVSDEIKGNDVKDDNSKEEVKIEENNTQKDEEDKEKEEIKEEENIKKEEIKEEESVSETII